MFYRGLKFPHRAMVLLALETDAACTSLCGHSARRKSTMFVLVWCYKPTCDTEQDLWKYWLPEGWFSSGSTSLCVMVASARSMAGEEWIIDIAVSGTLAKCCDVQYADTRFRNISDQYHWPGSPLM